MTANRRTNILNWASLLLVAGWSLSVSPLRVVAALVTRIQPADVQFMDFYGGALSAYGNQFVAASNNTTTARNGRGGIAYTYQGTGNQWTQTAEFAGLHSGNASYFSYGGVELYSDTLIVGAPGSNFNGNGAAYIYDRNLGGTNAWGERAYLQDLTTKTSDGDEFGQAVGIDSNFAIVGSPFNDDLGTNVGKLFVYGKNTGGTNKWGAITEAGPADKHPSEGFGQAVALSGSLAIVGAPGDNTLVSSGGSAYVFQLNSTGAATQLAKLTPPNPADIVDFGRNVEIYGTTAIVSSRHRSTGNSVLSVYDENLQQPTSWNLSATLELPGTGDASLYGNTMAVGAPGYQVPGKRAGAVLLLKRDPANPGIWQQVDLLTTEYPDYDNTPIGSGVSLYDKTVVTSSATGQNWEGEVFVFYVPEPSAVPLLLLAGLMMLPQRVRGVS